MSTRRLFQLTILEIYLRRVSSLQSLVVVYLSLNIADRQDPIKANSAEPPSDSKSTAERYKDLLQREFFQRVYRVLE